MHKKLFLIAGLGLSASLAAAAAGTGSPRPSLLTLALAAHRRAQQSTTPPSTPAAGSPSSPEAIGRPPSSPHHVKGQYLTPE
jgi:hypothetical protein